MSDKSKKRIVILTNCIIAVMLVSLAIVSFSVDSRTVFNPDSEKPYYQGNTNVNNVSLMFNVYWGTEYLDGILNTLDKYGVKATFFVGGTWVEKNGEMLKRIYNSGHEIGNHGYFHKDHDKLSMAQNRNEIEMTNNIVNEYLGITPKLFAPPSGAYSNTTLTVAKELNMETIMWSKDTIDWRDKNKSLIYSRATKGVKGGDLILAHPTQETLSALDSILQYYKDNGFSQVIVGENIKNARNVSMIN